MFATVGTLLERIEGCPPQIRVGLRDYPHVQARGPTPRFEDKLRLTIADARELAAVLTYWADAAAQRAR